MIRAVLFNLRGARELIGYFFGGLIMFLFGLVLFFPEESLQRRLQYELAKNIPGKVVIETTSLQFPFSIRANNVLVRLDDHTVPEIRLDSIKITPHLSSLIGKPGLRFDARSDTGSINGSVTRSGNLKLETEQYSFDEPIQGFTDLRLAGTIDTARIDAYLQPEPDKPAIIKLAVSGLALNGTGSLGLAVDRINLGQLKLELVGKGRTFKIVAGTLAGGDVQFEAGGTVLIGRTVPATRLNLEVEIKPATTLDRSVSSLFELIGKPGSDNARKIKISGSLAQPNLR